MYPIIYAEKEIEFQTLGYGVLSDCLSCIVSEELNGQYILTMKYPKNGIHAEYLQVRNIIVCQPNSSVERDAFRIVKVNRSMRENITVTAYHLSYDLSGYPVLPATASDLTGAITLLNNATSAFTITTDKTSSADFKIDVPSSVRSWFGGKEGSLIDIYGGEWKYNFWDCQLTSKRGQDTGIRIAYGVNIAQYVKESDDNYYSHVMSYFAKEIDSVLTVVSGDSIAVGATAIIQRTLIRDVSDEFEEAPTVAQLNAKTNAYIQANQTALLNDSETITVTPELLGIDNIEIGDTVHVIYDNEIADSRVVKIDWDVISDKYSKIELGKVKTNIAETIKSLTEGNSGSVSSGGNYLPLSGGTMLGDITMSNNADIYLDSSGSTIEQKLADSANYGTAIRWNKATAYTESYKPSIGYYNQGAICILPYPTDSQPWSGHVGLFLNHNATEPYARWEDQYIGRFTSTPTSGRIPITDGTVGGMISSAYSFTESTASVSLSFGGGTATITVRKKGNVVYFNPSIGNSSKFASASSGDSLGTLPSGYRPSAELYMPIAMRTSGTWASATYYPCYLRIQTSGAMSIYGNTTNIRACTNIAGAISFPV